MKEEIWLCDIKVEDIVSKRKYTVVDFLLVGDDIEKIEANNYFYNSICKEIPITPVKLRKLIQQKSLKIRSISFKKKIGETTETANWQTTRTT